MLPASRAEAIAAQESGKHLRFLYFSGYKALKTPSVGAAGRAGAECLSPFYPASFTAAGRRFPTAEHWMMWSKATLFGDGRIAGKILQVPWASQAKQLGRQITGFDQRTWDQAKAGVAKTGNLSKFRQNPLLAAYLQATTGRILVEASAYDRIWGIGLPSTHPDAANPARWAGENLLGFTLGAVREALREEILV